MDDLNYNCGNGLGSLEGYHFVMNKSETTPLTGSLFGHIFYEAKINNRTQVDVMKTMFI